MKLLQLQCQYLELKSSLNVNVFMCECFQSQYAESETARLKRTVLLR